MAEGTGGRGDRWQRGQVEGEIESGDLSRVQSDMEHARRLSILGILKMWNGRMAEWQNVRGYGSAKQVAADHLKEMGCSFARVCLSTCQTDLNISLCMYVCMVGGA